MKYTQKTFTLPACNKEMTTIEWEIRMGQRCEKCKKLVENCKCKK